MYLGPLTPLVTNVVTVTYHGSYQPTQFLFYPWIGNGRDAPNVILDTFEIQEGIKREHLTCPYLYFQQWRLAVFLITIYLNKLISREIRLLLLIALTILSLASRPSFPVRLNQFQSILRKLTSFRGLFKPPAIMRRCADLYRSGSPERSQLLLTNVHHTWALKGIEWPKPLRKGRTEGEKKSCR